MEPIVSIAGLVTGILALAGVVYAFGFWRGKVDKQLSDLSKANVPERIVKMETKMEVLWTLFTEQTLANCPNLAMRGSAFKLTEDAKNAIEEVKELLPPSNPGLEKLTSEHMLIDLPNAIGMDNLKGIADKHNMTLGELLSIISLELGIDI